MKAEDMVKALAAQVNANDAVFLQRFFKTGSGQYGQGDVFIGVRVPQTRAVCKQFRDLPLAEVQKLLKSDVHEHRLAALILLANAYPNSDKLGQQAIFELYLNNLAAGRINNWDLVDMSAAQVVGAHLNDQPRELLARLAKTGSLWQRRVAIISTFYYLKRGDPAATLEIAEVLVHDPHDLIQKAVGWALREMGKKVDEKLLLDFLERHAVTMPRTMLRYAIERLNPAQKVHFMKRKSD